VSPVGRLCVVVMEGLEMFLELKGRIKLSSRWSAQNMYILLDKELSHLH
jgi:hypothetical protein